MDTEHVESDQPALAYALPAAPPNEPLTIGNVAVLALRLLGIYCLLQAVPLVYELPVIIYMLPSVPQGRGLSYFFVALSPVINAAIGLILLTRTRPIALRLVGVAGRPLGDADAAGTELITARGVQAVAFSVVGVILFVQGAVELVQLVGRAFAESGLTGRDVPSSVLNQSTPALVASGVRVAAGLWLFFRANRLSEHWHRRRLEASSVQTSV